MKISVVMPSFNQGRFVESALRSVIDQDYGAKEIIFVDGGSTDETMSVVRDYASHISYCVSERDQGQSDALRKGFEIASGDILTWLNTDDLLLPGALTEVAELFLTNARCQWVFGNVIWMNSDGVILRCRKGDPYSQILPRLGALAAFGPSAFFAPELYRKVGGVNLDLHYMMDTDLWWRFVISGAEFKRLQRYTWALRLHEDAKMSGHMFRSGPDYERTAMRKRKERTHINQLVAPYRWRVPQQLARPIQLTLRIASRHYMRSLYDSWKWRGSCVESVSP